MKSNQFQINFWGVRGSIPCPGVETVRYGGNTPCVEMKHLSCMRRKFHVQFVGEGRAAWQLPRL